MEYQSTEYTLQRISFNALIIMSFAPYAIVIMLLTNSVMQRD
jgi:hypothetical protein